jgi:epoxyqueuosine reductase
MGTTMATGLTAAVKDRARSLGFDLVGVTTTAPLVPHGHRLAAWVAAGMHGAMGYMAEHAPRAPRPAEVVQGARSAVVVALAHRWDANSPGEAATDENQSRTTGELSDAGVKPLRGRISSYAWGTDYHRVMEEKLRALSAFLMERGAAVAHYYVDTGPLLDRALAQRAGLGWFGKNTMLITKAGFGSYVFLGELLTDLTLESDPPMDGSCGQCRICLDQCPTGAIVAPFVVDARRCISYLTIELRGWIPRDLRPLMGTWVYGSDICQDVCPHNTLVRTGQHAEFAPRRDVAFPDLLELLHLDERMYQERFRHSAIKRAKRQGLRRNAAVALGNLRDQRAVPALTRAVDDKDPIIRGHAAWALGRIGGAEAQDALRRRAQRETDATVLAELEAAVIG